MWRGQWEEAKTFAECYGLLHELPFLLAKIGDPCGREPFDFLAGLMDPANTEPCRAAEGRCVDGKCDILGRSCPHVLLERKAAEVFLEIIANPDVLKCANREIIERIGREMLSLETQTHMRRYLNGRIVTDAIVSFRRRHDIVVFS